MFTLFVKNGTLEIFNPRGLRMVSVKIYAAHFSVFNRKHFVYDFHSVLTCTLKLLLLLSIPAASFAKRTPRLMKSLTSFQQVLFRKVCIHGRKANSVMFKSKHGPFLAFEWFRIFIAVFRSMIDFVHFEVKRPSL